VLELDSCPAAPAEPRDEPDHGLAGRKRDPDHIPTCSPPSSSSSTPDDEMLLALLVNGSIVGPPIITKNPPGISRARRIKGRSMMVEEEPRTCFSP
jgi:hypothetical protein